MYFFFLCKKKKNDFSNYICINFNVLIKYKNIIFGLNDKKKLGLFTNCMWIILLKFNKE